MLRRHLAILLLSALMVGCAALRQPSPQLPVANRVSLEQLVIYGDFDLPQEHRVLRQLDQMRGQIATQLAIPMTDEPIHVYLFKTPKRYRTFLQARFPTFPERRAFFVQTDTRLSVYAQWGDRVAEDLRHEVAHGYIHAVAPTIPLWIDEGLAEYFEVNTQFQGLNRAHADQLIKAMQEGQWRPRLANLERLTAIHDMQQIDYAEAWAWAHYLLETTPDRRALLHEYLGDLEAGRRTPDLAVRIREHDRHAERHLWDHLESIAATRRLEE